MKEIGGDYLYYQRRDVTVETATCGGGGGGETHKLFHPLADWPVQAPAVINICICKRALRLGKFGRRFSPATPCAPETAAGDLGLRHYRHVCASGPRLNKADLYSMLSHYI